MRLSRRQKKRTTYFLVGIAVAVFAYSRYAAGDAQTAGVIGVIALIIALLGLSD